MFARLRGVQDQMLATVVEELLVRLTLTPHADKLTHGYRPFGVRYCNLACLHY